MPSLARRVHLPHLDGNGLWPAAGSSIFPTAHPAGHCARAWRLPGVSPLPHWAGPRSIQPAYWGAGRVLAVGAWPRSRTHRLWLRLCAREPGREGGARSRERSCGCVETLGAAEPGARSRAAGADDRDKGDGECGEGPAVAPRPEAPSVEQPSGRLRARAVRASPRCGSGLRVGAEAAAAPFSRSGRGPHARTGVWCSSFSGRPASIVACTLRTGEALRTPPPAHCPASLDRRGAAGLPDPDSRPACRGPRERKPGRRLAVAAATLTGCCTGSSQPW